MLFFSNCEPNIENFIKLLYLAEKKKEDKVQKKEIHPALVINQSQLSHNYQPLMLLLFSSDMILDWFLQSDESRNSMLS